MAGVLSRGGVGVFGSVVGVGVWGGGVWYGGLGDLNVH